MDFHLHLRRYQGGQEDIYDSGFTERGDGDAPSSPVPNESQDAMAMDDYSSGGFGSGVEEQDDMDINSSASRSSFDNVNNEDDSSASSSNMDNVDDEDKEPEDFMYQLCEGIYLNFGELILGNVLPESLINSFKFLFIKTKKNVSKTTHDEYIQ